MGEPADAKDQAQKIPDKPIDACATDCPKPPCPDGCSLVPVIKAKQSKYTAVLDKSGNPFSGYPLPEFEITNGCPNHLIDIQVAKDSGSLSGGPGLKDSWTELFEQDDKKSLILSSYSLGEESKRISADGKASFTVPLGWWRDIARLPLNDFKSPIAIYFRVITLCDIKSGPVSSAVGSLTIENNLIDFNVTEVQQKQLIGDIDAKIEKYQSNIDLLKRQMVKAADQKEKDDYQRNIDLKQKLIDDEKLKKLLRLKRVKMEFKVREPKTTEMYTIVQWFQGSFQMWLKNNDVVFPDGHTIYGIQHRANFPDKTIDSQAKNPRYHLGIYALSSDSDKEADIEKIATDTDEPNPNIIGKDVRFLYMKLDFETKIHLNFDVPSEVDIYKREPPTAPYTIISARLTPDPPTLHNAFWNVRHLQERIDENKIEVSNPDSFDGTKVVLK